MTKKEFKTALAGLGLCAAVTIVFTLIFGGYGLIICGGSTIAALCSTDKENF